MIKGAAKFSLAILLVTAGAASAAYSQAERCAVRFDVRKTGSKAPVTNVNLKLSGLVNEGEELKAFSKTGKPYFRSLSDNAFVAELSAPGYKKMQQRVEIACREAVGGVLTVRIEMPPGSPRETVNLFRAPAPQSESDMVVGHYVSGSVTEPPPKVVHGGARDTTPTIITGPTVTIGDARISGETPVSSGAPKIVSKGVLNGSATSLPKPPYPRDARAAKAAGAVNVYVHLDEEGNVISAEAVSGHELLRAVCVEAAKKAKFKPTLLSGTPVRVKGVVIYNFQ